ncbi:MAG: hypothetical protein ISR44_08185 [Rhodospirillales bacterium]|nr:hypothetical protein [Rhodospirillales bacterium]
MRLLGKIAVLLSLGFLAGCASQAAIPVQGPIQPVAGDVIRLDVAQIEIFRPAAEPGTVIDMSSAVEAWLREHLVAVGASGRIRAGINNAAVRQSVMRRTAPGGTSFERIRQYDGMIHVRIDATDRSTQRAGFAGGSASRSQIVAAEIPVAQQQQVASDMADALMTDFSYSLSADVRQRLAKFLR